MECYEEDKDLGWMPAVPCPFYCWQFWCWQKVRCMCGKEFVSKDLGLIPPEYRAHYILEHIEPLPEEGEEHAHY